jgi:hypothetical protein
VAQRCVTVSQAVYCVVVIETIFIQLCCMHAFSLFSDFIPAANTFRLSSKIFSFSHLSSSMHSVRNEMHKTHRDLLELLIS